MTRKRRGLKAGVKSALKTTADVAGKVEEVSGSVKRGARHLESKINASHKATRADSPTGVIVREEASALPELAARIFVDPLDTEKQLFGKPIVFTPAGAVSTTIAYTNFDNYVYSAYSTAVIQAVRYDLTGLFSIADFRSYTNKISNFLVNYYSIAAQLAYMLEGSTVSSRLNLRTQLMLQSVVEQALRNAQFVLETYTLPPELHKFILWLSKIYSLDRTPNSNDAQFITEEIASATTPPALANVLRTLSSNMTDADRRVSAVINKLMPEWKMSVDKYVDMPSNSSLDFNWLNMWYNTGFSDGININPVDNHQYVLFNDNPNATCSAMATIWDSVQTQFEPNIIQPTSAVGVQTTMFVDNVTGLYTPIPVSNDRLLGGLRNLEYQPGGLGTGFLTSLSTPATKSVSLDTFDTSMDVTAVQAKWFDVNMISSVNRALLNRR
jgi:hypothetical protein